LAFVFFQQLLLSCKRLHVNVGSWQRKQGYWPC